MSAAMRRGPRRGPMAGEKLPDMKSTVKSWKALGKAMKKYLPIFIVAAVFIVISVVLSVYSPQVLKDLTNQLTNLAVAKDDTTANDILQDITKLGIILAIFYVAQAICAYVSSRVMAVISQRYSQELREQIEKKINVVPLRYFDSNSIGDILSRLTNDVDQIAQSLQQSVSMLVSSLLTIIAAIIAMFCTCWQMTLVALALLPIIVVVLVVILKIAGPQFMRRQTLVGDVDGMVEENYNGQMVIKVFNTEDREKQEFNKKNRDLKDAMFKSEIFGGLMQPLMSFLSYLSYAAVCIAGGLLMNAKAPGVTMGTIAAFLMYVNLYQSPLSQIAQAMNSLQSAAASSERVFAFLNEGELPNEDGKPLLLTGEGHAPLKGEVVFDHVSFSYDGKREIVHDFSAHVKAGSKVAIVGPTGAGKTTMVNLLMRFYETGSGNITIDGVNLRDLSRAELHSLFAMVLQDTWIFDGTLRENLAYNTPNVTEEDFKNVIHDAHLTHFVRSLPGGLDYQIQQDSTISGGQKQLITIGRAMLKKAPMLILDEATSNVDTRTEEKIQEAMDRLSKGKTSFVIAHRLSTIRNADLILVMKDGNIIEQGNHDSLMAQNGFYASLYNSQFSMSGNGGLID